MCIVHITISAIHLKNPQKAKDYAKSKFTKLTKYDQRIEKIEVRLIGALSHRDKNTDFDCELKIVVPGHDLEIKDTQSSISAAIDKAEDRVKRLLVKNKEKHLSKKHKLGLISKIRQKLSF